MLTGHLHKSPQIILLMLSYYCIIFEKEPCNVKILINLMIKKNITKWQQGGPESENDQILWEAEEWDGNACIGNTFGKIKN